MIFDDYLRDEATLANGLSNGAEGWVPLRRGNRNAGHAEAGWGEADQG
jgi:hypothetical protein